MEEKRKVSKRSLNINNNILKNIALTTLGFALAFVVFAIASASGITLQNTTPPPTQTPRVVVLTQVPEILVITQTPIPTATPVVINYGKTIVTSIQTFGQLVSVSMGLAKADIQVNVVRGFNNACGYNANHAAQGVVEAGVELGSVKEDSVLFNEESDTITIRLPKPQLTSCRVDYIRQYQQSRTVCGTDWDEARMLAQHMAVVQFRDDAITNGIIDRAEQQSQIILTQFIQAITGKNVEIVFDETIGTNSSATSACQPSLPNQWNYNSEINEWQQP